MNIKTKAITENSGQERQTKTETICPEQEHKAKNFAYLASKPRLQKDDSLQNEPAKKPAKDTRINFGKTAFTKNIWWAMNLAQRLIAAQNLILQSNKTHN